MSYIYHIVSKDFVESGMKSDTLYPLNLLKDVHPEVYEAHAKKYENKKHVQELYIPQLHCYWGDVVHFSAINPEVIVRTLRSLGIEKEFSYYQIDSRALDLEKTVVYTNKPEDMLHLTEKDFVPFDPDRVDEWAHLPEETVEYYGKKIAEGKEPTLFLFIPHILYKGTVNVSELMLKSTRA